MDFSRFIFSKTIVACIDNAKKIVKEILKNEMNVIVTNNRFYLNNFSYPLQIIAFEHPTKLGYFNEDLYEIGINKCIFLYDQHLLKDLLRHELAHYMSFIKYGSNLLPHGKEFQEICKCYNWGKEISSATIELTAEEKIIESDSSTEKLVTKIQKLLALASSHHIHEAEAATLKINDLLLRYNLDTSQISKTNESEMQLIRLFQTKKISAKHRAISSILRHFFVYPIYNHGRNSAYLEIFGNETNVKIAEYVGIFLFNELDLLWEKAKEERPSMKGIRCKNSFFDGIAEGYGIKVKASKQTENCFALIHLEKNLEKSVQMAFPRLKRTTFSSIVDSEAVTIGRQKGKKLQIYPGVTKENKNKCYINYVTN